jgi:hypothetical protein
MLNINANDLHDTNWVNKGCDKLFNCTIDS